MNNILSNTDSQIPIKKQILTINTDLNDKYINNNNPPNPPTIKKKKCQS